MGEVHRRHVAPQSGAENSLPTSPEKAIMDGDNHDETNNTNNNKIPGAKSMMNGTSSTLKTPPPPQMDGDLKKELSQQQQHQHHEPTPLWVYIVLASFVVVTVITCPEPFHPPHGTEPTVNHVFFYGWLTAISTGLGVVPFIFMPRVQMYWIGISNAIAAGMMIAASYSLIYEGWVYTDPQDTSSMSTWVRTLIGAMIGVVFMLATKAFLDEYEDLKISGLGSHADARKALLIFFVMMVHSFSEGVGVGVSFGGVHGSELGLFISASLAVHNVPEGLAIAVVLLPRGASVLTACLWAICTSLPQPLMAVPAYVFIHHFIPVLPIGLGFAGGAMSYVAVFELLMEAIEDTNNIKLTALVTTASLICMLCVQHMLEEETRS